MPPSTQQKTVYIAMCADLLHSGHLNIINVGCQYGTVIVGLLTDEAMASYKRRPIMAFVDRRIIVQSIKGVDRVITQATLDYRPNLLKIRPDFVVHGSDWRTGVQAETRQQVLDVLAEWGGKLVEPSYTPGVSTTQIIQKIQAMTPLQSFVQGDVPAVDLDPWSPHTVDGIANPNG